MRSPTAYFACRPSVADDGLRLDRKFTGRLEHPAVATAAGRRGGGAPLGGPGSPSLADQDGLLALWDFGRDPASFGLEDASGNGNHGRLFGLPMRSVTGSNWDRETTSVDEAPDQYRAIHFFADAPGGRPLSPFAFPRASAPVSTPSSSDRKMMSTRFRSSSRLHRHRGPTCS
jgi:hypothetical protein